MEDKFLLLRYRLQRALYVVCLALLDIRTSSPDLYKMRIRHWNIGWLGKVRWDAGRFATTVRGSRPTKDKPAQSRLSAQVQDNLGEISTPCIITDCHGRIIGWYLPDLLDSGILVWNGSPVFLSLLKFNFPGRLEWSYKTFVQIFGGLEKETSRPREKETWSLLEKWL